MADIRSNLVLYTNTSFKNGVLFSIPTEIPVEWEIIELAENALLIVEVENYWVNWVLLECYFTDICQEKDKNYYAILAEGAGVTGMLRELRHTQFTPCEEPSGYIFYINPKLLADAFNKLSKWFDC